MGENKMVEEDNLQNLAEREQAESDKIPIPSPPRDLNDVQDMKRYDRDIYEYMMKTTPIRRKYVDIWRNNR